MNKFNLSSRQLDMKTRANDIMRWLKQIEHIEGSYATSKGTDIIQELLDDISSLENQLDQRGQYGIDWE